MNVAPIPVSFFPNKTFSVYLIAVYQIQKKEKEHLNMQTKSDLQIKLDTFTAKISKKLNKDITVVQPAVEKAVYILPRLKNYFTKLEKAFKLLVNHQDTFLKLINFFLDNPNVDPKDLRYTLCAAHGRSIKDEIIIKELSNPNLEIKKAIKSQINLDFQV